MREFFGGLLVLAAFALFIISIIALIKPLKTLKLGSRKRAALALVGSFILMMIGGSILPPPSPEEVAAREAEEAQAKAKREQTQAAEKKARDDASAAELARLKPVMTQAATQLWNRINSTVADCDAASEAVSNAAGARNANPYTLYPLVQRAESVCSDEALELRRIEVPDEIPSRYRDGFREAIETCSNAYIAKMSAFDSMAKVLDGNTRPSASAVNLTSRLHQAYRPALLTRPPRSRRRERRRGSASGCFC